MVSRRSLKRRQAHDVSIHDGAVIYSSAEHSLKKTNKQKNECVDQVRVTGGRLCGSSLCVSAPKEHHLHVHCSTRRSWDTEDYLPRCHPVLFVIASSCCCCFVFFPTSTGDKHVKATPRRNKTKSQTC